MVPGFEKHSKVNIRGKGLPSGAKHSAAEGFEGKLYSKKVYRQEVGTSSPGEDGMCLEAIREQAFQVAEDLLEAGNLKPGQVMILGCSTSEVRGKAIGSSGSSDIAKAILDGIEEAVDGTGVCLAVQCCEHLNRCLVVERHVADRYNLTEVTVRPVPNAGGATASTAMQVFDDPVVVESIQAHAGIDIGDTFIGMHLKPVAVPVRLAIDCIGHAHVTVARTRPKLIGGRRAVYE